MNRVKSILVIGTLLVVLGLSSCLRSNNNQQPIEYERLEMGTVKVSKNGNNNDFEHTIYMVKGYSGNEPFFYYSKDKQVAYFPIFLYPKGSKLYTPIYYAIELMLDLKNGVPELNKPYAIKQSSAAERYTTEDRIWGYFILNKKNFLSEGSDGIACVYNRDTEQPYRTVSADGTITFTSFDTEKNTCTATYELKTREVGILPALTFTEGNISTKIYTDLPK